MNAPLDATAHALPHGAATAIRLASVHAKRSEVKGPDLKGPDLKILGVRAVVRMGQETSSSSPTYRAGGDR